jgi:acetyl esterase/lipase
LQVVISHSSRSMMPQISSLRMAQGVIVPCIAFSIFAYLIFSQRSRRSMQNLVKLGVPELQLWPRNAKLPHDIPITLALRHKLYPAPPMRDTDKSNYRPSLCPRLIDASASNSRPAILVFPGGGYGSLSDREGLATCDFLNEHGIHAILVKYRVQRRHPGPLLDARRAIQLVRVHADEWNVDQARIGVIGFSAGGHLAGHVSLSWDSEIGREVDKYMVKIGDTTAQQSAKPDIAVLSYPVVSASGDSTGLTLPPAGVRVRPYELLVPETFSSMGKQGTGQHRPTRHHGSMEVLLGSKIDDELAQAQVSLEILAKHAAGSAGQGEGTSAAVALPPFFIWAAADDMVVPSSNALLLASALLRSQVPVEIHMFERGGAHGLGLGRAPDVRVVMAKDENAAVSPAAARWTELLLSWLGAQPGGGWVDAEGGDSRAEEGA